MKKYLISIITVLMVLAVVGAAFGQDEERARQRDSMRQRLQNMSEAEREKFMAEMRKRKERYQNMSEADKEKFRAQMRERFGAGRPDIRNMSEAEREKFMAEMRKRSGRISTGPQEQLKAIEAIEELVSKLKAFVTSTTSRVRGSFRDLSEEGRAELREKMAKAVQERQKAIRAIEEQLAKLRGQGRPQQPQAERQPPIGELRAIHDLAVKEKATQTARRLEKLIARYQSRTRGGREREPQQRPERLDKPPRERPDRERPTKERPPRERPDRERPTRERPDSPRRDVQDERPGKRAPRFELNSFDGKTVSLSDHRGKIVVLEWFNFECPLSRYHYETKNTMVELAKKYKGKNVVWFAVNSTSHTTPEPNKTFAERHRLPYLILDDRSGKVGRAYGAQTTPHMYVIDTRGNLVYEGAIDNNRRIDPKKKDVVNYVDNALAELTARKAISTPKTKPYGCTVKYAKK